MRAVYTVHVVLVPISFLVPSTGAVEYREAIGWYQEFMGPDLHLALVLGVEAFGFMLEMTVNSLDNDGPILCVQDLTTGTLCDTGFFE